MTATPTRAYLPGLDGLRALSVLVVVAFHCGLIDGGWIGVDVFFGISGFLITGLLVDERSRSGTISLRAFWGRRFRRLVPALVVMLGLVAVLTALDRVEVASRDVWGAITYSTNWVHIASEASYWDQFATPDPLRHLWSLAIEEQFYVVWPLVAWFVLRRRTTRTLGRVALSGAVLSALVQVSSIGAGSSIDRVYQGTDTRAVTFLLGAFVATRGWPPVARRSITTVSITSLALVGLASAAIWLPGDRDWVFAGPLLAVSVAGIVLVTRAAGATGGVLNLAPLRAVGRWSYGIYLFHWPLTVADVWGDVGDVPRFAMVTLVSVALAAASHRFVETPVRRGRVRIVVVAPMMAATALIVTTAFAVSGAAAPVLDTTVTLAPRSPDTAGEAVKPERVMVFGDSLPAVAAEELREVAGQRGLEIDVHAEPGCSPSENPADQYGKPECVDFLLGAGARAAELDIDTVVIWWGGTFDGFVENGVTHYFCAAESTRLSRDRIRRLVGYFDDVVDEVVLVEPVPRLDIDAADAAGTECEIRHYEAVADELGVRLVRLRDAVCPSYPDDCERIERYDGLHYDGDAALVVAGLVLNAV